jgi:hypothetical protein
LRPYTGSSRLAMTSLPRFVYPVFFK